MFTTNKYRFYVTDWAPNGLSDLIITDRNGTIIEYITDALFGPRLYTETDDFVLLNYYGESVGCMRQSETDKESAEYLKDILDGNCFDVNPVYRTNEDPDYLRGKIAISPIDNGSKTLIILNQYLEG